MPERLAENIRLARGFSDFIYGAHLRYNVIFSNYEDTEMEREFQNWLDTFDFNGLDIPNVLSKVNSNLAINAFLKSIYDAAIRRNIGAIDNLIIHRERAIKHDRAKLCKPQEYRYDIDNPIHYFKLNYRYDTAIRIIGEILDAMEG